MQNLEELEYDQKIIRAILIVHPQSKDISHFLLFLLKSTGSKKMTPLIGVTSVLMITDEALKTQRSFLHW